MPQGVSNDAVAETQASMPSAAPAPAAYNHPDKRLAAPMTTRMMAKEKSSDDMLGGVGGGSRSLKSAGAAAPMRAELAKDEDEKKTGNRDKAAFCKISVTLDKAEHAGDAQSLRALVERSARTHDCKVGGPLKLRITVDAAGKITSVVLLSGDSGTGKALVHKLTGAISATRATGHDHGTVELTLTVTSK